MISRQIITKIAPSETAFWGSFGYKDDVYCIKCELGQDDCNCSNDQGWC
jgi:hypothetical protein